MAARRHLPSEFSASSNTANSSISGSSAANLKFLSVSRVRKSSGSIDQRSVSFFRREPADHAGGGGAQFCGRSVADLPPRTPVHGRVFAGQPISERRVDQEPDVRHGFHGNVARDPFPP